MEKIRMINKSGDGGLSFSTPSKAKRRQIVGLMETLGYRVCTAEELRAAVRRGEQAERFHLAGEREG